MVGYFQMFQLRWCKWLMCCTKSSSGTLGEQGEGMEALCVGFDHCESCQVYGVGFFLSLEGLTIGLNRDLL